MLVYVQIYVSACLALRVACVHACVTGCPRTVHAAGLAADVLDQVPAQLR